MTKKECLDCESLELSDAGDYYVADVAATCTRQEEMPKTKNQHGVMVYGWKDNLILQSVVDGKLCAKFKRRK